MYKSLILVAMFAQVSLAQAAGNPLKPGKWWITFETVVRQDDDIELPPIAWEICVTEEDVKKGLPPVTPNDPENPCKVKDMKIEGNEQWWSVDCPNLQMSGHLVFTENSFNGDISTKFGEQEMLQKQTGRWMGACEK